MVSVYPVLSGEIARRGIKKKAIADVLGISDKAFRNKMAGKTAFTWPEVCTLNETYFPDIETAKLFERDAKAEEKGA